MCRLFSLARRKAHEKEMRRAFKRINIGRDWNFCVISDINYGFDSLLFWQSFPIGFAARRPKKILSDGRLKLFASEPSNVGEFIGFSFISCVGRAAKKIHPRRSLHPDQDELYWIYIILQLVHEQRPRNYRNLIMSHVSRCRRQYIVTWPTYPLSQGPKEKSN